MKFQQDPRMKKGKKMFWIAWIFFSVYLIFLLGASYTLGIEPRIWGLPRWIAVGNIFVPIAFVILLIFVVEKLFPDIDLTDHETDQENEK
jgi:uncharacterized membrane protein YhdT